MENNLFLEIESLYEDEDYLVVGKPAGLVVHYDGKTKERTLADWVLEKYPHMKEVGEPLRLSTGEVIFRPGIVHRIDRETSGVLLIAKNQESYLHAKKQFQERTIKKRYHAFLYGEIKNAKGEINRPIGRSKNDFRKWTAQRGARGGMREAVTKYELIKKGSGFSYVEVEPLTGRTHQIRVHFKAINHPIVCDKLYAEELEDALGFKRLALHARSLEFSLMSFERKKVEAPFPKDFLEAQKLLD